MILSFRGGGRRVLLLYVLIIALLIYGFVRLMIYMHKYGDQAGEKEEGNKVNEGVRS